jgi:hypothetical protein
MTPTSAQLPTGSDTPKPAVAGGYFANFDRIGRNHEVAPLEVTGSADDIAEQVYRYARRFLASRDVEVQCDLEEMRGIIFWGFQVGGHFELVPR